MAKVVHFELPVDDGDRAASFYAAVLGWQATRWGEQPYWLVQAGADDEPGANGALIARDETHPYPVVIAGVASIDDVLPMVLDHGGAVVQQKLPVPGVGWSAYVRDPESNLLGLFEPEGPSGAS